MEVQRSSTIEDIKHYIQINEMYDTKRTALVMREWLRLQDI